MRPDLLQDDPSAGDSGPEMSGTRNTGGGERLWLMLIQPREGALAAAAAKVRLENIRQAWG